MNFEKELDRIAEEYRDEGYAVITHPNKDHLDGFPDDLGADILATRGNEKVLVQVKHTRADVEADTSVPDRAKTVNARPGWRYDLIVLEKETAVQRVAERAQEPTDEQFLGMLNHARMAKGTGLKEMALTYAWAALEAAMRRLRDEAELYGRTTPTELLRTLYGNGFLSRSEFDRARMAWSIRTQAVHGFVPPEIDPALIDDMLALAEKVKGREQMQASPAAG
ncbi:MAG TPA: hypothetical protein VG122_24990 [Gemmata sp.]|jgi:hypothetical protein|nr:hypothetical protein [Gemmata sp.]